MIQKGLHARVPVVLSTVRNESLAFIPGILSEVVDVREAYRLTMDVLFKERAADVERHYATSPDSASMDLFHTVALTVTDSLFTCYARYLARLLMKAGSPVFLSTFMHAPSA